MQRWERSRLQSTGGIVDWVLQGLEGVDTSESKMVLAFGRVFTL